MKNLPSDVKFFIFPPRASNIIHSVLKKIYTSAQSLTMNVSVIKALIYDLNILLILQDAFSPTDGDWPRIMRVNPILKWRYQVNSLERMG